MIFSPPQTHNLCLESQRRQPHSLTAEQCDAASEKQLWTFNL